MKTNVILTGLLFLVYFSCSKNTKQQMVETWKNEIIETELNFSKMAQEKGMNIAFLAFVANDGVLLRNEKLIRGKDSIKAYMKNSHSKGLSWKPDFVDVSASGDLGYSYGEYTYNYQDSSGNNLVAKGVFHTVWKRQEDDSWKFVWD